MSFGASSTTKQGLNDVGSATTTALDKQLPMLTTAGTADTNVGAGNVTAGTNFFNTLLNGNRGNTTALLQPNINDIRGGSQNTMNAINTLTPRGGGRSGALFGQSFAPTAAISNLFGPMRANAATALPGIGLQQQQIGTNLFGLGNQALNTGLSGGLGTAQIGQTQQQINNSLAMGIGKSLFGLATMPFGGGSAANGLLGLIPGGGNG